MKKTLLPFLSFLTPQRVQVAYMIPVKRVSVLAWRIREPGPKTHLPAWTLMPAGVVPIALTWFPQGPNPARN